MKITLVRHGEVETKYHKRYNGHIDIGLSKEGEVRSLALAEAFKARSFDLVYCSDLKRSRDTLAPFVQAKQAIYTKKLREKSWGKHEGMSFDEIIAQEEIVYEDFLQWINALDGEPYELYIQRVEEFFLGYLSKKNAENILVLTHAGVIRILISLIKELSLEEAFSIDVPYSAYIVFDTNKMSFSEVKY